MPATGNQALPYAGTIFEEATIFACFPGGLAGGVQIGMLQEVSFEQKWDKKELDGPGSRMAYAVGFAKRSITIKAKHSVFSAQALVAAAGGAAVYSSNTTVTSLANDQPPVLKLILNKPADGSDCLLTFNKVLSSSDSWQGKAHDWSEADWEATAYPDYAVGGGTVYTIVFPGNQTAS
jgi:hypothetical protein